MTKRFSPKASSEGTSPTPQFALRFISGKYQGGEFPLGEGQEIVIGRSSELDMVLVEEMVSRKHARIALEKSVLSIEDMGSTNGTFVNGEKVERGTLREGDRVLIGTNILK
ncbi:MAG TPA: FHA domain-containing protein, partial [Polyangiaceae bacterium]